MHAPPPPWFLPQHAPALASAQAGRATELHGWFTRQVARTGRLRPAGPGRLL
ncbi:hypothetical protein [Modestobacter roseus]|uniref:hypothetical protein n=1 Tax=Modestobacter roseus TaxID=1181884 RepID=UPI0034DEA6FA